MVSLSFKRFRPSICRSSTESVESITTLRRLSLLMLMPLSNTLVVINTLCENFAVCSIRSIILPFLSAFTKKDILSSLLYRNLPSSLFATKISHCALLPGFVMASTIVSHLLKNFTLALHGLGGKSYSRIALGRFAANVFISDWWFSYVTCLLYTSPSPRD